MSRAAIIAGITTLADGAPQADGLTLIVVRFGVTQSD